MADHSTPKLQQLLKTLKPLENWFVFGVILGVPVPQLKKIESSYSQRELERCKIDMLQYWLENKLIPTWKEVIQALEQSDQLVLAAQVKHDYLCSASIDKEQDENVLGLDTNASLPAVTPPSSSHDPSPAPSYNDTPVTSPLSSTTSSAVSPAATSDEVKAEIRADIAVVSSLRELEGALGLVLVRVKRLLILNKYDLSDALLFLGPIIGSEEFIGCDNFGKLMWQLQRDHIDVFNISILQQLVACFDNDELIEVIKEYNERKESFLKHTTVLEFQRAVVSRVEPILTIGKASVTITISREMASHQTLRDIEELAMEGFEECHRKFIHLHAEPGSIIISWVFPKALSGRLEQLAYDNAAVFKASGVLEVTVGGKRVFPCTQDKDIGEKEKSKLKLVYIEFYQQLVEAVSDPGTCLSLTTQLHSTSLLSEEKKAVLSSGLASGSSFLKRLGVEEEPHLVNVLMEKMLEVKQLQTLSEDMSDWLRGSDREKQTHYESVERQQLLAENKKLASDKADLLKRIQCYEDDLKRANELLRMREKAITGMMSARGRYTDVEEREKRINLLKKELEELRMKGIDNLLSREVDGLKSKLASMTDELDKAIKSNAELSSQILERDEKINELRARLEQDISTSLHTESAELGVHVPASQIDDRNENSGTVAQVEVDDENHEEFEKPSLESKLEEEKRKFEAEMQRMYELKLNEMSLDSKREGEKYATEMQRLMDELKLSESKLEIMRHELFQKRELERQEQSNTSEIMELEKRSPPDLNVDQPSVFSPPLKDDDKQEKMMERDVDPSDLLPIPLFILGDNNALRQELFHILASPDASESSEGDIEFRKSSLLKGFTTSHKYMQRQEISVKLSESEVRSYSQYHTKNPIYLTQDTLSRQQFILHVPTQDLDPQMVHIYFKSSGPYLIVISLEDLVKNPLSQYSKLFYWVNLIHTYIGSEKTKRMIIVGMYSRSRINEDDLLKSLDLMNKILQQYSQAVRLPIQDRGFVFKFDREDRAHCCQDLFSSIVHCLTILRQSAYNYDNRLYMSIFEPFQSFHKIASKIALNHDGKVIERKEEVCQWYYELTQKHVPQHYYETLMAYSPVCISKGCEGCLLTPSLIPDLLSCAANLSKFDKQVLNDPNISNDLPIVSTNMLKWCFNQLQPGSSNFEFLLWWMEKLNLIYNIGLVRKDVKLFVPYLDMSDRPPYQWDKQYISMMFQDSVTIYAQFSDNLPTTIHLFHRVIAQLLRSIINNGLQQCTCFVTQKIPEAVLPLYDNDQQEFLCEVWVRYRAVQNIMEFQAVKVQSKFKLLKTLERELSQAYIGSLYYNKGIDFNRAVSFHIPGSTISETNPYLCQLAQLESSMDKMSDHLVATTKLTEPGNRQITPVMREWCVPETTVLPPDLHMSLSKKSVSTPVPQWTPPPYRSPNALVEKKLPADMFINFTHKLNVELKWADLGLRLNLLRADEVEKLKSKLHVDKGAYVLQLWTDSHLTYQDLFNGLQYIRCYHEAEQVEQIAKETFELQQTIV